MDKQEYREIVGDIRRAYDRKEFDKVLMYADELEMRKVSDSRVLEMISDSHAEMGNLGTAKDLLLKAYEKTPLGRKIAYKLSELSIATGNLDEAVEFYEDYCKMAPNDNDRYLLKYKLGKAGKIPKKELAKVLSAYCTNEVDERWMAELADLYDSMGEAEKCNEVCDDIILWFADGEYVKKALELKSKNGALTSSQENKLQKLRELENNPDAVLDDPEEDDRDLRPGSIGPEVITTDDLDAFLKQYITIEDATNQPKQIHGDNLEQGNSDMDLGIDFVDISDPETEVIPVQQIRSASSFAEEEQADLEDAKKEAKRMAAVEEAVRVMDNADASNEEPVDDLLPDTFLDDLELDMEPVHAEVQEHIAENLDQPEPEDVPDVLGGIFSTTYIESAVEAAVDAAVQEEAAETAVEEWIANSEAPAEEQTETNAAAPEIVFDDVSEENTAEYEEESEAEEEAPAQDTPMFKESDESKRPFSNIEAMQVARTAPPKDEASFWKMPDELTQGEVKKEDEFEEPVYGSHRWFEEKPEPDYEEPIYGAHRFVSEPVIEELEEQYDENVVIEQVEPEPIIIESSEEEDTVPDHVSTIRTTSSGAELLGLYAAAKSAGTAENLSEKAAFVKKPALGVKRAPSPELFAEPTSEPEYYEEPAAGEPENEYKDLVAEEEADPDVVFLEDVTEEVSEAPAQEEALTGFEKAVLEFDATRKLEDLPAELEEALDDFDWEENDETPWEEKDEIPSEETLSDHQPAMVDEKTLAALSPEEAAEAAVQSVFMPKSELNITEESEEEPGVVPADDFEKDVLGLEEEQKDAAPYEDFEKTIDEFEAEHQADAAEAALFDHQPVYDDEEALRALTPEAEAVSETEAESENMIEPEAEVLPEAEIEPEAEAVPEEEFVQEPEDSSAEEEIEEDAPAPFMFSVMPHASVEEVVPEIVKERIEAKTKAAEKQEEPEPAAASEEPDALEEELMDAFEQDILGLEDEQKDAAAYEDFEKLIGEFEAEHLSDASEEEVRFDHQPMYDDEEALQALMPGAVLAAGVAAEGLSEPEAAVEAEAAAENEFIPEAEFVPETEFVPEEEAEFDPAAEGFDDFDLDYFVKAEPENEPHVFESDVPEFEEEQNEADVYEEFEETDGEFDADHPEDLSEEETFDDQLSFDDEELLRELTAETNEAAEPAEETVEEPADEERSEPESEPSVFIPLGQISGAGESGKVITPVREKDIAAAEKDEASEGFEKAVQDFEMSPAEEELDDWEESFNTMEPSVEEAPIIEITASIPPVQEVLDAEEGLSDQLFAAETAETGEAAQTLIPENEPELSDFEKAMLAFEKGENVQDDDFDLNELDPSFNDLIDEAEDSWEEPEFGLPDFDDSEFDKPDFLGTVDEEPQAETVEADPYSFAEGMPEFESEIQDSVDELTEEEPEYEPEQEYTEEEYAEAEPKPEVSESGYQLPDELADELREFLLIDGMEGRICNAIGMIINRKRSGDPTGGHMIITGDAKSGKTYLTISIIKAVGKEIGSAAGRVAKVQAESLNGKDMQKVFGKIKGSDLIIENAGYLNDETVRSLVNYLQSEATGSMVTLEGNQLGIENIIIKHPEIENVFRTRIDLDELTLSQWADQACAYAEERGYTVGDMALLALHAKIDEMNLPTTRLVVEDVQRIIDRAIEKAERRSSGRFLFGGKKGRETAKELNETDFM